MIDKETRRRCQHPSRVRVKDYERLEGSVTNPLALVAVIDLLALVT
jgi:hypothetical protein